MSSDDLGVMIGLEVHVQLTELKTKLFCSCDADYRGKEQNTLTCPTCLGLPGTLPVLNERALEFATRLSLALESKINDYMFFFRKNYFYPDMAKNFQISMYNKAGGVAFADGGKISIKLNGKKKDVRINRLHLEEDPGRLVHQGSIKTSPFTLVDYNRHGITLIEVVSEPDMTSPQEAREYLNNLKLIISYIGIANLDLEGSCRVDANISLKGGKRVEVKNINSFKEVEDALKYEIIRQKNMLKRGKIIEQETRHWDGRTTISLRQKEEEMDYRYFPEQDLVPFEISKEYIKKIEKDLPELPKARNLRFRKQYHLTDHQVETIILDKDLCDFFEETVNLNKNYGESDFVQICNWLINDIQGYLNEQNLRIRDSKISSKSLAELVEIAKKSSKIAKSLVPDVVNGIPIKDTELISDDESIRKIAKEAIEEMIEQNPNIINEYKKDPKVLNAFIGPCMKKSDKKIAPKKTRKILRELLSEY